MSEPHTIEKVEKFWSNIWEKSKTHNTQANQDWSEINFAETTAINKTSNWKAPETDGITNFWCKNLGRLFMTIIETLVDCPEWLT